jgi:predicted transcriptional regulator
MKEDITPDQMRAARALLRWSRDRLGKESGVAGRTIARFEAGQVVPRGSTVTRVRAALEAAGVRFLPGNNEGAGVRFGGP